MLNINEQDIKTAKLLATFGIQYRAIFLTANVKDGGDWEHDSWNIHFMNKSGVEVFQYRTGLGHRIMPATKFGSFSEHDKRELRKLKECLGLSHNSKPYHAAGTNEDFTGYDRPRVLADIKPTFAVTPTQASVLYCLLSDMQCSVGYSFNEFCDNLGYDQDSRRAEKIYFACQETGEKLRRLFTPDQITKISELLEGY